MKLSARKHRKELAAIVAGVLVSISLFILFSHPATGESVTQSTPAQKEVFLSTSTIPVRVSGVVEATDSTIIYAETAGVVTDILAQEGARVNVGAVLTRQSIPVVDAQLQLAREQGVLTELQQASAVANAASGVEQAGFRAYSAAEIATLRSTSTANRTRETSALLVTTLRSNVLTAVEAINYINDNRPLFSAEGLRLYDETVTELYGKVPNYFRGGVALPVHQVEDVLSLLDDIQADPETAPLVLQEGAVLVQRQLDLLSRVFATAESDVFDRSSVYATTDVQAEYIARRGAVLTALQTQQTVLSEWQQVIDAVLEESVSLDTNVAVTEEDKRLARIQSEYAQEIAAQSAVVSRANSAVLVAQRSLGVIEAPFAGVVSQVHVDQGQYVAPGTPLLTLIGSGARELTVSVPSYLLPGVAVGQAFMVGETTVGFVNRLSPVSTGGSGQVIVSLTAAEAPAVGTSVVGNVLLDNVAEMYSVPRNYVHFSADGPYIVYGSGERSAVEIVYDTGDRLFLRVEISRETALVAANSISL